MQSCPICYTKNSPEAAYCHVCGTSLLESVPTQIANDELSAGTVLREGRYTVLSSIGRGGFGITYRAFDNQKREYVAIKELYPEGLVSRDRRTQEVLPNSGEARALRSLVTRFELEANTISIIRHPAAVTVLEIWEELGTAYMAMEMLEGETLEQRIFRGTLSESACLHLLVPLLECLFDLHERDLLHRDIKPSNIMISHGDAVLIDFGSAAEFAPRDSVRITHRVVTPAYAPLEQYASVAKLGPYTDIYSLGATFYEAITGVPPPGALERSKGARLVPVQRLAPEASSRFASTLEYMLEERISDRPQTAQHVLHELGLVDIKSRIEFSIKSLDEQNGVVQRFPNALVQVQKELETVGQKTKVPVRKGGMSRLFTKWLKRE
ncbi:MAG: protein kinase domain-containing protein [Deinococcales bacterium]